MRLTTRHSTKREQTSDKEAVRPFRVNARSYELIAARFSRTIRRPHTATTPRQYQIIWLINTALSGARLHWEYCGKRILQCLKASFVEGAVRFVAELGCEVTGGEGRDRHLLR